MKFEELKEMIRKIKNSLEILEDDLSLEEDRVEVMALLREIYVYLEMEETFIYLDLGTKQNAQNELKRALIICQRIAKLIRP